MIPATVDGLKTLDLGTVNAPGRYEVANLTPLVVFALVGDANEVALSEVAGSAYHYNTAVLNDLSAPIFWGKQDANITVKPGQYFVFKLYVKPKKDGSMPDMSRTVTPTYLHVYKTQ